MKKGLILSILTFILYNCSKKIESKIVQKKENLLELKTRVVEKGDKSAFTDLILKIGNSKSQYEILPYAMIMANKYNSGEGCYEVLLGILSVNNPNTYGYNPSLINKLTDIDKQIVFSYLNKGAKLKNENCILGLEEIYRNGWGTNKDISKADSIRNVYETTPR